LVGFFGQHGTAEGGGLVFWGRGLSFGAIFLFADGGGLPARPRGVAGPHGREGGGLGTGGWSGMSKGAGPPGPGRGPGGAV